MFEYNTFRAYKIHDENGSFIVLEGDNCKSIRSINIPEKHADTIIKILKEDTENILTMTDDKDGIFISDQDIIPEPD